MEYKLPKEFIDRWVKVLQSGGYKKGRGQLLEGYE